MLFQRCFINVETTLIKIRRLKFHFQSNVNVKTTLVSCRWSDVILSTLYQQCFANVETTSINLRRLNFHFQPNINVETTLMNVDDQRCFNVDSKLMCLLEKIIGLTKIFSAINYRRAIWNEKEFFLKITFTFKLTTIEMMTISVVGVTSFQSLLHQK